jgi:type IV pilus assembly protein PilM
MKMMTFRTVEVTESEDESIAAQALQSAIEDDATTASGQWISEAWSTHLDTPSHGGRNYALLGIEESLAEGLAAVLWRCGLDCRIVDGLPFALARAVNGSADEPVAVIDWGDCAMTLTIVIDGRPYFTRLLRDCELRALTGALMRPLDLEPAQCQQLLAAYGFCRSDVGSEPSDMTAVLGELSAPYLHHVREELQRTWAFLQQLPGQTPKSVILTGGGAAVKRSVEMVRAAFPVPTKVWTLANSPNENDAPYASAFALAGLVKNR